MKNTCGIILLAAGSSTRLGTPKQALVYKKATLLEHCIAVALASMADQVIVVLGAHAETITPGIKDSKLSVVVNAVWKQGMASSMHCGLRHLLEKTPAAGSAVFMACDQPYISAALLNKLITLQRGNGHTIVASQYAGTTGIPAIFDKTIFPDLMQLKGDAGAKKIILQHQDNMATVAFARGAIDIDTTADYNRLQNASD